MPKILNINFTGLSKVNTVTASTINNLDNVTFNNDNKTLLIGGNFKFCYLSSNNLARIFTGGTQDTTLNTSVGFASITNFVKTNCIEFADNDSMYIGGNFETYNGVTSKGIIKITSGGTQDTSFVFSLTDGTPEVFDIKKQTDNKILVGGNFTSYSGGTINRLIRVNTGGTIDNTFSIGTGFDNVVRTIAIDSIGKIYVGGDFTTYSGVSANRIIKLNTDGTIDYSFTGGTGFDNTVYSIKIDSLGGIYVGGNFTSYSSQTNNRIIKLSSGGTKDVTFDNTTGFNGNVRNIKIDSSDKLYVIGEFSTYKGSSNTRMIKLNADGSKDTSFDNTTSGGFSTNNNSLMSGIEIDSDGRIYVGGTFTTYRGVFESSIIKLNTDGTKDTNFQNIGSIVGNGQVVRAIRLDSAGNIIICGDFNSYKQPYGLGSLKKYDGSISYDFNPNYGYNVSVQLISLTSNVLLKYTGGTIYVGGYFENYMLTGTPYNYRSIALSGLDSGGTPNVSVDVNTGANSIINQIRKDSIGGIYLLGQFTTYKSVAVSRFVKINYDASIDNTFVRTGLPASGVSDIAFDTSNNLFLLGSFTTFSAQTNNRIVKVLPTGYKDTSFETGTGFNGTTNTAAVDSSGKVYVVGSFTTYSGISANRIVRLNSDGSFDNTFNFGSGFTVAPIYINIYNDKIYIAGPFTTYNGLTCPGIVRLNTDGSIDTTYVVKIGVVSSASISSYFMDTNGNLYICGLNIKYQRYENKKIVKIKPDGSYDILFDTPYNLTLSGNYNNFFSQGIQRVIEL
jgi:uncharacterized delta-60 repeat protein